MAAQIGASVVTGFRAANRSWPGIGLYAAGWVLLGVVGLASVLFTNPPPELFEEATVAQPAVTASQPQAAQAQSAARAQAVRREAIIDAWFSRAWPGLLGLLVVYLLVTTWLSGGQLGYVTQRVRTQQARLAGFRAAGTKSFGALLCSAYAAYRFDGEPVVPFQKR